MCKYNIIYADPPWKYWGGRVKGAGIKHYPVMELKDICRLPVNEIAADDSVLFLWTTFPKIYEALEVITAWGFEYKTVAFVWVKQTKSGGDWFMVLQFLSQSSKTRFAAFAVGKSARGYWTRSNAEICLLATKGKPVRFSKAVHQLIISPVEQHSKKPDVTRDKIVELAGNLPRVELFARQKARGWDVWGNEVDCDITLERRKEFE